MKYVLIWLLGVLVGGIAAAAALYYNPFTVQAARGAAADATPLAYRFPEPSVVALSHGGDLGLPSIPADIPPLWEAGIKGTVLSVMNLGAPEAVEAVASRLSVPSMRTNLLLAGIVVDDYWLVTMPEQGSLFVAAKGNYWPVFKDAVIPVGVLNRPWSGPKDYRPTHGPAPNGAGEVVGATGQYVGRTGTATELLVLERYSAGRGFESVRGELNIAFDDVSAPRQDSGR